jgi:hypothetical protein
MNDEKYFGLPEREKLITFMISFLIHSSDTSSSLESQNI